MNRSAIAIACVVACALAAPAPSANFVVNSAGPHDSVGYWFTTGNALLFPTYSGPMYPADKISITGTLSKVHPDSLAKDSSWWLKASTGSGTAFSFVPLMTQVGSYTTLTLTSNNYGLFWIKNYPQYRFEAVEYPSGGIDDPGVDAQWTNMTFEFHAQVPIVTTGWTTGTTVSINTGGSNINTKLALYSADGMLLEFDDGTGPGGLTQLDASGLGRGDYYLVAGGLGSTFQDDSAMPGTDAGDLQINLNGSSIFAGALESERLQIINITVVPEAGSLVLIGAVLSASLCWSLRLRAK